MKKTILFFSTLLITIALNAVPAKRITETVTLTDGTQVEATFSGDEFYHYWQTADGRMLERNDETFRVVAENATDANARINQKRAQNPMWQSIQKFGRTTAPIARINQNNLQKSAGTVSTTSKGLVIMVNFSDKSFTTNGSSKWPDILCAEGTNSTYYPQGSAQTYFNEQSNGKYTPEFDVVGPYTVSNTRNYYATGNGAVTSKDDDYGVYYAHKMINEACSLAYQDGVDFSKYDSNGDKVVDFVYVVYAGYSASEGASNCIWPHSWELSSSDIQKSNRTYGGYAIDLYACSSELRGKSGSNLNGIGTFCHEFSHVIGLPDYYDTKDPSTNDDITPNSWSLMDYGCYNNDGKTPPNYSAYDKYYMGWATPTIMNKAENVTLPVGTYRAVTDGTLGARSTSTIYYFENRQQTGWDTYVPGHGMVVWKVQYNATAWTNNEPNNTSGSPRCTVVPASGTTVGNDSDPFPGTKKVTSYTPLTGKPLTEIAETSNVISFKFMGGVNTSGIYSVYFDGDDCTMTNYATEINEGETFTATITPNAGYTLTADDIAVTMGGEDYYGFTYYGTTFTITNVTGDLEIIAIAKQTKPEEPEEPSDISGWVLVTNVSTLKAGDVLVIASNENGATAGDIENNVLKQITSTFSDNKTNITALGDGTVQLTLGGTSGAWTFANSANNLLGSTAAKKMAWDSGTTTWSISISDNNATITNATSNYGYLQYNTSSPRFTTYTSSQGAIQLYKKVGSDPSDPEDPTEPEEPEEPSDISGWVLVTNVSTLKAGDVLVIASNENGATAGDIESNVLKQITSTFSDDKTNITALGDGTVQLTLGGTSGAWTFANSANNLLGATAAKKMAWDSGTTTWSISISDNNATITNATSNYGYLQYNTSSPRFTTYTSSQGAIQLYKKVGSEPSDPEDPTDPEEPEAYTIAEWLAKADGTNSQPLAEVAVTYCSGKYLFVQDETGALMIYGSSTFDPAYTNGQRITGISGKYSLYNGTPEMVSPEILTAKAGAPVAPTTWNTAYTSAAVSTYVYLSNVTFSSTNIADTSVQFEDGTSLYVFNCFSKEFSISTTTHYNVTGIAAYYQNSSTDMVQIFPTAIEIYSTTNVGSEEFGTIFAVVEENSLRLMNVPAEAQVCIVDVAGRIVSKEKTDSYHLSKGVYLVHITNGSQTTTLKAAVK